MPVKSESRCEDQKMGQSLLTRAAQGEQAAFRELTDPYRRELQFHCYRILGSMVDAEDALQETLVSPGRGLARFEQRSPLRAGPPPAAHPRAVIRAARGDTDGRGDLARPLSRRAARLDHRPHARTRSAL